MVITVNFTVDSTDSIAARHLSEVIATLAPYMVDNVDVRLFSQNEITDALETIYDLTSLIESVGAGNLDTDGEEESLARYEALMTGISTIESVLSAR